MALIVPLTIPAYYAEENGEVITVPAVEYPASYARVLFARAFSDKTYICMGWYADEAARFGGADPVKLYEYQADTAALAGDFYPAVYAHIKTLEDFAAATDHPLVDPAEVVAPAITEPAPEPTQAPAQA